MNMHNPASPGEVIADLLEELSVSNRHLARALNVAPSTVKRLIAGETAMTPEMAIRLAAVLGSTPQSWMNLQTHYSLWHAAQKIDVSHLQRLVAA